MQAQPDRGQFEAVLAEIFAGLDKPFTDVKREALWRGCQGMSTVQLGRIRDAFFADAAKGDVPRSLGVRELWGKLRDMRAYAPTDREEEAPWPGGVWEIRANLLLLAHIRRQAALGIHYASAALTQPLVEAKHQWADLMRSWDGQPSAADQKQFWERAMQLAEARCREVRS